LDKPALVPEGFDLDAHLAGELSFPVGGDIHLKVLFDNRADVQRLEESPLATNQKLSERDDGRYELTAKVADTIQLRWWLRGYGERVEVVSPKSLRQEFIEMVKKLSNRY
jgi:predicted DNA-binding transcriptional regulator YafY